RHRTRCPWRRGGRGRQRWRNGLQRPAPVGAMKSAALFLAIASALTAATARAQPQTSRADDLFQQGRADVRSGNWSAACPKFAESLRLEAAPGTRLNLAECEEKAGHLVRAVTLLHQAAAQLAESDQRRPFADERARAIEARIARIVVADA